jgi:hypothetical protein
MKINDVFLDALRDAWNTSLKENLLRKRKHYVFRARADIENFVVSLGNFDDFMCMVNRGAIIAPYDEIREIEIDGLSLKEYRDKDLPF